MTIRTRLTLWYVGIIFTSLLVMVGLCYHEFVIEPRQHVHRHEKPESEQEEAFEAVGILLWCALPAALLAIAGSWWLMRQVMRPLEAITHAANEVNERNLRGQLPRSGNGDELDRLTEVFNAMIARLDGSFHRIREFTLHASHELKTPLTILHGELETALQDANLSEEQRERCHSQLDEVQRLTHIVDGLTLLTKADAGLISLTLESVSLDDLVRDAFADAQILAKPFQVQASLGACEPVKIQGDRHRMRQLLLNLTDNAAKYNQPGGTIGIELRHSGTVAQLRITNTGKGIAPDLIPHAFDRFFRGDPNQNRIEGCGLGLSIAKWIVNAHHGAIEITSNPSEFTRVLVTLPAADSIQEKVSDNAKSGGNR
ncbi:MAG TPA: HAMP domain-containing sensor histidine kinase [Verrucomicrobiae bacterium]|jgi:signal transduction histidine kinase|nr:HAMP domain-containing sensor histidine kinase [Verrucomicrobiae bacterium]